MTRLRYKCLVLDHDDTVMDSTSFVHHPAFLVAMEQMRPGYTMSLEDYFRMNFHPGFVEFCKQTLHFTQADFDLEVRLWQQYIDTHVPTAYPGMARIIRRQKELGGFVCVVSHSFSRNILRDYRENDLPEPDLVYGWELPHEQRKPDPYALDQIMARLDLKPKDLLMVDDLKPGYEMAKARGVDFAAAAWAYDIPEIRDYMKKGADVYCTDPEELEHWLFDEA